MYIQLSTTAHIQATAKQLDMIFDSINTWANGNENICTTIEEIAEAVESGELKEEACHYFFKVVKALKGIKVGDIVFHK